MNVSLRSTSFPDSIIDTNITSALSIYTTSLLRTLSSSISLSKSSNAVAAIHIDHVNLVIVVLEGLSISLRRINWISCDMNLKNQIDNALPHLLTMILEYLIPSSSETSTSLSTNEAFIIKTLDAFHALLEVYLVPNGEDYYKHSMRGPFLAQVIQSSVLLAQYPDKQVASTSMDLITKLHLLTTLQDDSNFSSTSVSSIGDDGYMPGYVMWRNYYPGVFSNIFMLCCGRGKVNSSVKVSAFRALLGITTSIIEDRVHSKLLKNFFHQQSDTLPSIVQISSGADFLKALNINNAKDVDHTDQNFKNDEINSGNMFMKTNSSKNLPFVEANTQWRVDILQKLETYFFKIYEESVEPNGGNISNNTLMDILKELRTLLLKAQVFLGSTIRWKIFDIFVRFVHNGCTEVRTRAKCYINELICGVSFENNNENEDCNIERFKFGEEMKSKLLEQIRHGIETVSNHAKRTHKCLGQESDHILKTSIHTLIGSIDVIGSDFTRNIFSLASTSSSTKNIFFQLSRLVLPSVAGTSSIVLINNDYIYLTNRQHEKKSSRSIEAGYYRCATSCTDNDDIKKVIRELLFVVGKHGDFLALHDYAAISLRKTKRAIRNKREMLKVKNSVTEVGENDEQQQQGEEDDLDTSALVYALSDACSVWTVLSHACLGVVDSTFITPPTVITRLSCAQCGLTHLQGDLNNTPVSRCSRCKSVGYCCKQHQFDHWKIHKFECSRICEEQHKAPTALSSTPINSLSSSTQDPYDILTKFYMKFEEKDVMNFQSVVCRNVLRTIVGFIQYYQELILQEVSHRHVEASSFHVLTNGRGEAPQKQLMNMTERTLLSLLLAQLIEVIANLSFILGIKFRSQLVDVFYILVELTVDQNADIIVRQASASTLKRVAMYLDYNDVYEMLKENIDYIVDNACIQLRNSVTLSPTSMELMTPSSRNYNYRSALVVDAVFNALGSSVFQSNNPGDESKSQVSFSMLKDMILDTIDNIDQLAATSSIAQPHTLSLIRVMNVMVYHALEPRKFIGIADNEIQEGMAPAQAASTIAWSKSGSSKVFLPSSSSSSPSPSTPTSSITGNDDNSEEKLEKAPSVGNSDIQTRALNELQRFKSYMISALSTKSDVYTVNSFEINNKQEEEREAQAILSEEMMYDAINEEFSDDDEEEEGDEDVALENDNEGNELQGEAKLIKQKKKRPPGYDLVCEILKRCTYFLASLHLESQVLVIDTMMAAFRRLSNHRSILLPNVHNVWPVLMTRFKEQSKLLQLTSSPYFQFDKVETTKNRTSDSSLLFHDGDVKNQKLMNSLLIKEVKSTSTSLSSSFPSSCSHQDNIQMMVSRQKILLLPGLLDIFGLLSYICGSFLSLKFEENIWPSFLQIIRVIASDAILEAVSNTHSSLPSSSSSSSRFDLNTKLKLSSLRFIYRLCKMSSAVNSYLKHVIPQLTWMCIPFLHSSQHVDVNNEAKKVISALCRLDQYFVRGLLFTLGDLSNRGDASNDLIPRLGCPYSIWMSIITEPRIIRVHTMKGAYFGSVKDSKNKSLRENISDENVSCVPMCDKLLEIYCTDKNDGLGRLVREIYTEDVQKGISSIVKI